MVSGSSAAVDAVAVYKELKVRAMNNPRGKLRLRLEANKIAQLQREQDIEKLSTSEARVGT